MPLVCRSSVNSVKRLMPPLPMGGVAGCIDKSARNPQEYDKGDTGGGGWEGAKCVVCRTPNKLRDKKRRLILAQPDRPQHWCEYFA